MSQNLELKEFTHKTKFKLQLLDIFLVDFQEQLSNSKSVVLVFNQGMKNMLKEAVDSRDLESQTRAVMKLVKVLRGNF